MESNLERWPMLSNAGMDLLADEKASAKSTSQSEKLLQMPIDLGANAGIVVLRIIYVRIVLS